MAKVLQRLPDEHVDTYFVPLATKLATNDWYTSRASATCLLHLAYGRVKDSQRQYFKDLFVKLCSDDTPTVRKLGAFNFTLFCYEIISVDGRIPQEFIRIFTMLSSDDQVWYRYCIYEYI